MMCIKIKADSKKETESSSNAPKKKGGGKELDSTPSTPTKQGCTTGATVSIPAASLNLSSTNQTTTNQFQTIEDKTQKEYIKEQEKRLNQVFEAMGEKKIGKAMAKKINRDAKVEAHPEKLEKEGDIVLNLSGRDRKTSTTSSSHQSTAVAGPKPEDDTIYQAKQKPAGKKAKYSYKNKKAAGSDKPKVDYDFGEPTATTYMANNKDIEYLAHDMMRTINKPLVTQTPHVPDPCASVDVLEKRACFTWEALHANTFLANAACFVQNQEDKKDKGINTMDSKSRRVRFKKEAIDLTTFDIGEDMETCQATNQDEEEAAEAMLPFPF